MKKFTTLAAAALIGMSALSSTAAEARGGGAIAAGVIGGLAAGALLGAAVSEAHAAPAYGYGYARPAPVYGYEAAPVVSYRPARVVRSYEYDDAVPVYRAQRVIRGYEGAPGEYGYRPAGYGWRRHCDRPDGYRNW